MAHRRIGQVLVDMGFITDEQLELLVDEQTQHPGQLLGRVAIDLGLIDDEQLAQALAEQLSLQSINVADLTIPKDVLGLVTEQGRALCKEANQAALGIHDTLLAPLTTEERARFLDYMRLIMQAHGEIVRAPIGFKEI